MKLSTNQKVLLAALALSLSAVAMPAAAQATIYRCHALSGDLVFQDKPCNSVSGTREAKSNTEGEVVAVAPPPPQDDGTPAIEHYTRYLDFVSKDRREQQASDEAEASRLRARAEADRALADNERPACPAYGPNGECLNGPYYDAPYAYVLPRQRYPGYYGPLRPPVHTVPTKPVNTGPRPPGAAPPPPPKRDARSEILSFAP